ncbi:hypothetical protein ABZ299_03670 [Streptomyces sp. NPDC006184]|uniref:hypothetical protein n=1 Tax=Streptomyces sp. NPDC006184 TaxID=3155455 RepID=UPI0033BE8E94
MSRHAKPAPGGVLLAVLLAAAVFVVARFKLTPPFSEARVSGSAQTVSTKPHHLMSSQASRASSKSIGYS